MKKFVKVFLTFGFLLGSMIFSVSVESKAEVISVEMGKKYDQYLEDDIYASNSYLFSIPSCGAISVEMEVLNFHDCQVSVLDQSGKELWSEFCGEGKKTYIIDLVAGNYTLKVSHDNGGGNYSFMITFETANESFLDDGTNYMYQAPNISIGLDTYYGQLAQNDKKDLFCFQVVKSGKYVVDLTVLNFYDCGVSVLNQSGKSLWHEYFAEGRKIRVIELDKGIYYLEISKDNGTGNYKFCLDYFSEKYCSHEYNQTVIQPTYNKEGYTLNVCKQCGKSYKSNIIQKKKLGKVKMSRYSYGGKKKLVLSWNCVFDATGYQIRYCKSKAMKKGVKIKTIKGKAKGRSTVKKLSRNKKYYVQVRAYKKIGIKTVYGKWSSKKCLKTK